MKDLDAISRAAENKPTGSRESPLCWKYVGIVFMNIGLVWDAGLAY